MSSKTYTSYASCHGRATITPGQQRRRGCASSRHAREAGRAEHAPRARRRCAAGRCPWPAGRSRNRRPRSARRPACRPSARPGAACRPAAGARRAARRIASAAGVVVVVDHADQRDDVGARRQRVGEEVCRRRPRARPPRPAAAKRARARSATGGRSNSIRRRSGRARPPRRRKAPSPPPTSSRQRCRPQRIGGQDLGRDQRLRGRHQRAVGARPAPAGSAAGASAPGIGPVARRARSRRPRRAAAPPDRARSA